MLSIKEMIDGMECFIRFTRHAEQRMVDRMVCYDDVLEDCRLAGEEILSCKEGEEVNVVNTAKDRISCIAINSDEDYNLFIDVKTVINEGQIKRGRKNIIINNTEGGD